METPSAAQAARWLQRTREPRSFGRHSGAPAHRAAIREATVLVLHQDEQHTNHLAEMVHVSGLRACCASDLEAATVMITQHRPDLVLAALSGADLLQLLQLTRRVGVKVAVLAAAYDPAERDELLRLGATDYLSATVPMDELVVRVWWHVRPDDPKHRYLLNSRSHLMVELQRACLRAVEGTHVLARVDYLEREDLRRRLGDGVVRATDRQLTQRLAAARPAGSLVAADLNGGTLVLLQDVEPSHPVWELGSLCSDLAGSGRAGVTPVIGYQVVSGAWSAEAAVRRASGASSAGMVRQEPTPVDADSLPPVPAQVRPASGGRRGARDGAPWRILRRAGSASGTGPR